MNRTGPRCRNAARTTIAPTGTLSIIAGCSSGIEPLFALSFTKNILDGAHLVEVNPYFEETGQTRRFLFRGTDAKTGRRRSSERYRRHTRMKSSGSSSPPMRLLRNGISKCRRPSRSHTDNAVSKTVNFPKDATREDVAKVYLMAYEEGLKGITIYRDGSRERPGADHRQRRKNGREAACSAGRNSRSPALRASGPRSPPASPRRSLPAAAISM